MVEIRAGFEPLAATRWAEGRLDGLKRLDGGMKRRDVGRLVSTMTIDQPHEPRPQRASDTDRERTAEILRNAFAEGRLDNTELNDRLDAVWESKTRDELRALIRDLPEGADDGSGRSVARTAHPGAPARGGESGASPVTSISVFSGSNRSMRSAQDAARLISVFGGSDLDVRQAVAPGKVVVVNSYNVFGGADVIVDDGTEVRNEMISILGGDEIKVEQGDGDKGTLVLRGFNVFGGLSVRRPNRREMRRRD